MPLIAKMPENDGDFEKAPIGTHQAVCSAVHDLGFQKTSYEGKEKIQHKILIMWEIDKTITQEGDYKGKRFMVNKRYTLTFSSKGNLRSDLESWFSRSFKDEEDKGFDIETLVGKNCLISLKHTEKDDKTYVNVSGVMAATDGAMPMVPETDGKPQDWIKKIQANAVQAKQPAIQYENEDATIDDINDALHASEVPEDEVPFS